MIVLVVRRRDICDVCFSVVMKVVNIGTSRGRNQVGSDSDGGGNGDGDDMVTSI